MNICKGEFYIVDLETLNGYEVVIECNTCKQNYGDTLIKVWLRGVGASEMLLLHETVQKVNPEQIWHVEMYVRTILTIKDMVHYIVEYKKLQSLLTRKECFKCSL